MIQFALRFQPRQNLGWLARLLLAAVMPCAFIVAPSGAFAADSDAPFRPPAVPLVTSSPYFSIWSENDHLTDGPTRHWTSAEQPLESLIRIDGKTSRLMGIDPAGTPALPQTGLRVTPTRSLYDFDDGHVHVTLTFMTPLLPTDLDVFARPLTYLTWEVHSSDGQAHSVQVYDSTSTFLTVDNGSKPVTWGRETDGALTSLKAGDVDQTLFDPPGDGARINWGYVYAAAPSSQAQACIAGTSTLLDSFARTGALPNTDDVPPAPAAAHATALAFAFDLGSVGNEPISRHMLLAYDELYEVRYGGRNLLPYWKRNGATAGEMLQAAENDRADLVTRCAKFDDDLTADLTKAGGARYAQICALAYRECIAANGFAADANKQPMLFTKENTSNGDIATVDVIYPQAPIFLLLSPTLAKASIAPIMVYAASDRWKFPNAPHDLGTYPVASALGGAGEEMPVEESGNMLILCDAIVHAGGGMDFLKPWWPQLAQWAKFLEQYGLDPGNQLCTDDFMGAFAHNANLSVKAILALAAYGDLCQRNGDAADAKKYGDLARADAANWMKVARDGDHYRLAFDKPGWSQKYNLVWDRLLGLNIFPPDVAQKEITSYLPHLQKYGLPLDSRAENPKDKEHANMSKSDWSTWTATLAEKESDFERIVSPFYDFLNTTSARNPAADLYRVNDSTADNMHARPVVGGFFIKALADPALWSKWASMDRGNPGPWAPMPAQPVLTYVFPADKQPVTWRYTLTDPPKDWILSEFDDSKWEQGPNRAWEKEKAPKPDPTKPPEFRDVVQEVWMRTSVTLPATLPPGFSLILNGHYGSDVYVNGAYVGNAPSSDLPQTMILHPNEQALLKPGAKLVIAAHLHDPYGHAWIEVGLAGVKEP